MVVSALRTAQLGADQPRDRGGCLGELRVEQPLRTETERTVKNEKTLVQSSVRPVMYVTNPYSIKKVTGLNG